MSTIQNNVLPTKRDEILLLAKDRELQLLQNKIDGEPDRDGYGWRYLLPQLYMFANESFECLLAYQRYQHDYPDGIGDPSMYLSVALAYLRTDEVVKSEKMLYKLIWCNVYFLPHLVGQPCDRLPLFHGSNIADHEYIHEVDGRIFSIWEDEEIEWAKNIYLSDKYQYLRNQYIKLRRLLNHEKDIAVRRKVIRDEKALMSLIGI